MNFKRNCFAITALLASVFMVAGCSNDGDFLHYAYIDEMKDEHEFESFNENSYVKYGDYENYTAKGVSSVDHVLGSASDVMRNNGGKKLLNTVGNQKILVIPVDFPDFKCEQLDISRNDYYLNLKKSFFGNSDSNKYVSVGEYFNKSSYGKLRLEGEVIEDFYTFSKPVSTLKQGADRKIVSDEYESIINWLEMKNIDLNQYIIKGIGEPDCDYAETKCIPMFLVYNYPVDEETMNENFFWAYTFPNVPVSWASYSFLYTEQGKPDAHTFIHETGHLFGLNDYYPASDGDRNLLLEPTARIDMMDCSVGDETGLSKMYLDWTRPYHVVKSTEITIKPFTETGDLILIADSWNKTVFDEYYLFEFYTPTGLNAYDCNVGNSEAKLPTLPGIKVYHVDARLAYYEIGRTRKFLGYCDKGGFSPTSNNIDFAHNNNYSSSVNANENFNLYELVLNHSDSMISGCAQNGHLYRSGDKITGLRFNTGKQFNYQIEIESISFKEAKLKITNTLQTE